MHCLEDYLAETRKKSAETVAEARYDFHRQISKIEDKVYLKFKKSEETRHDSIRKAAEVLAD